MDENYAYVISMVKSYETTKTKLPVNLQGKHKEGYIARNSAGTCIGYFFEIPRLTTYEQNYLALVGMGKDNFQVADCGEGFLIESSDFNKCCTLKKVNAKKGADEVWEMSLVLHNNKQIKIIVNNFDLQHIYFAISQLLTIQWKHVEDKK